LTEQQVNEQDLLRQAKAGNLSAFESLVVKHSPGLYSFIYRLVNNQTDAEELTQQTWVKAWQNISRFQERSSFKTWLFRIGINLTLNYKTRRRPVEKLAESMTIESKHLPEEEYLRKRRQELVRCVLQELTAEQRTALILSVYEQLSYKEIAQIMGKSVRAVDSLLVRAKAKLHELLLPAKKRGLI